MAGCCIGYVISGFDMMSLEWELTHLVCMLLWSSRIAFHPACNNTSDDTNSIPNMRVRAGMLAALAVCALLSVATCYAEPVRVSLSKGPFAPMASLRPSIMQNMLQQSNGGADVPMRNFLDAQVCAASEGFKT